MNEEKRNSLVNALLAKGARHVCGRCGHNKFEVLGESHINLQGEPGPGLLGIYATQPTAVSTVVVACANCGHMWQHALSALAQPPARKGLFGLGDPDWGKNS